ncbi:hypothetical protein ABIC12_000974 [Pantoea agglomerans]
MNRVRLAPQTRLRRIILTRPGNNGPSARDGWRTAWLVTRAWDRIAIDFDSNTPPQAGNNDHDSHNV